MVRHFDQDERQTDAAVYWDSIRPVLVKAFAEKGRVRVFGTRMDPVCPSNNKVIFEYSGNVHISWTYLRATQGHAGRMTIAPELMGHVLLPYKWKEFIYHKGCSFNMKSILVRGWYSVEVPSCRGSFQWVHGCADNRSGVGEVDDCNTGEVDKRELVLVFCVL